MKRALAALAMGWTMSVIAAPPVSVDSAWARATPPGVNVAAVYAELRARRDDELIAIASPIAERTELHVSSQADGKMQMRKLERLPVSAGKPVKLAPMGHHLMLIGLREPLVAGRTIAVTFTFREAGKITTEATIVAPDSQGPP